MHSSASAYACIAPGVHEQRPATPERLRKHAARGRGPPGKIAVHAGLVGQKLPPAEFRYGVVGDRCEQVASVIGKPSKSDLEEHLDNERERIYRSHVMKPLGKSHGHLMELPQKTKAPDFAFGVTSGQKSDTKQIMYPDHSNRTMSKEYFHRKASEPPEKLRETVRCGSNNYDWKSIGKDPATFAFGHARKVATDSDGVADAMKCNLTNPTKSASSAQCEIRSLKRTEIARLATEPLGRTKPLPDAARALGSNFVYGRPDAVDEWDAGKTIKGEYSAQEQAPDRDLGTFGKSNRYRNPLPGKFATDGHLFGKPSIRRDKQAPGLRSLADNTNYGDEQEARHLLYPSKFSCIGINEIEFDEERTETEVREIFSDSMSIEFGACYLDRAMAKIQSCGTKLTIRNFHNALAHVRK